MKRKWIGRLFLASGLALLISGAFIAIYYNLINKEHTGPMDWWAVVLLVIPSFFFCFFRIIIDVKKIQFEEPFSKSGFVRKLGDIILKVFTILSQAHPATSLCINSKKHKFSIVIYRIPSSFP